MVLVQGSILRHPTARAMASAAPLHYYSLNECNYEALKTITIRGVYQYFEDLTKGSLKEGTPADLVILSQNPLKIDPMKLKDVVVLETIQEGKPVFKNRPDR